MYSNLQEQEITTLPDQVEIILSRLNEIQQHARRYSKKQIIDQIRFMNNIAEEVK